MNVKMDLRKFDQALLPFEEKLQVQEELRRKIGVRSLQSTGAPAERVAQAKSFTGFWPV